MRTLSNFELRFDNQLRSPFRVSDDIYIIYLRVYNRLNNDKNVIVDTREIKWPS